VKLTLSTRQLDCRDHSDAPSPLVLDRKESFVAPDYPNRDRFARFTEHERAHGLLDDAEDLASWVRWQERLDQVGLELRGKRLVWKPDQERRRPLLRAGVRRDETAVEPPEESCLTASLQSPTAEDQDQPRQCSSRHNRAQIGITGNEPTVTVPSRSRRYGIGKEIGGSVYVHRQYEEVLGAAVASAKRSLPSDFKYDVVKFNHRTQTVSFLQCPRFDHDPEPAIAAAIIVRPDGTKRLREFRADDPPIYHHKWLFVTDDYTGFDVEESERRSAAWLALPDIDTSRIGRQSYWRAEVLGESEKDDECLP
jgi:hypothetical protein